jgi:hypothetical protein
MSAKWRICPRCEGEGKSSAWLGAFTAEEFQDSFCDDEAADYMAGRYDRTCEECGGSGKVTQTDEDRYADRRADLYQQWLEDGRPEGSFDKWAGG